MLVLVAVIVTTVAQSLNPTNSSRCGVGEHARLRRHSMGVGKGSLEGCDTLCSDRFDALGLGLSPLEFGVFAKPEFGPVRDPPFEDFEARVSMVMTGDGCDAIGDSVLTCHTHALPNVAITLSALGHHLIHACFSRH